MHLIVGQITEYRNHTFQKREKGEYLSLVKAWWRSTKIGLGLGLGPQTNCRVEIFTFLPRHYVSVNSKPGHSPGAKPPGQFFDGRIPHPPGKKEFKTPHTRAYKN